MFEFLPDTLNNALSFLDMDKLCEIRLREGYGITLLYDKKYLFLSENGTSLFENKSIICTKGYLNEIIENVTEHSLYAYNDCIKQGFITYGKGVRIGLCGQCVTDNGKVITIKNISSLLIRIPHRIKDCSKKIIPYIINDCHIYNTLLISPPGCGKTTFLKDITININNNIDKSILIIDERGEFSDINGIHIDKISYSDKLYAFNYGIRSMSPQVVVTDELCSQDDWLCVKNAVSSGVNIIASIHGKNIEDVKSKEYFNEVFERYIALDSNKIGHVENIYDKDFKII